MNTPRFNYDRNPGATSRSRARKYSKWIRLSHTGRKVPDHSTDAERRKIYAVVAPPMTADLGGETIRRILIFDNHPDSLQLVFGRGLNADIDLRAPQIASRRSIILGLVLTLAIVLATLWLLL
jgi:hypothetical protein